MAINVGQIEDGTSVLAEINTTPLVDVMLVLLIIFLITIPVATHAVPVKLPNETTHPRQTKPENINISVSKDGKVYWNEARIGKPADLQDRLKALAQTKNADGQQPEVQVHGDGDAAYEQVGRIVLACQRAGILKIGFVTEPQSR